MLPKPVPHREQIQLADCLAACAAMILEYAGRPVPYTQLIEVLGIGPAGAPRRNIMRLTQLGVQVTYRQAAFSILAVYLQEGKPVIAFVDTGELAYWSTVTNHAVVVVGIEGDEVLVNDPSFSKAPQRIPREEFELAWLNCDNACAIIENL